MSKLDLNLLPVFKSIYDEGNLSKAATKLNITQPAVSHSLARLRDVFNDPLFHRQGNAMIPTTFAKRLMETANEPLNILQQLHEHESHFSPADSKQSFTVSLRDILESSCLPPLMQLIEREAPGIAIASAQLDRKEMEKKLTSNEIDLAIDVLLPVSDAISHELLTNDRMVVVTRKNHPAINKRLSLETYMKQKHILVSSRTRGPGREDFELSRLGLHRDIALRCQHYFSAYRVVSNTNMLLTMPETYAKILNEHPDTQLHKLPVDIPSLDVFMYWHKNNDSDAPNGWLREQLKKSVRGMN